MELPHVTKTWLICLRMGHQAFNVKKGVYEYFKYSLSPLHIG